MAVQRRNIYHLTKFLVHEGLAPRDVLQSLHKSQISRYRSHRPEHWSGYELATLSRSHLSLLQDFNGDHTAQVAFKAHKKVAMVLTAIIAALDGFRKEMRSSREQIVRWVEEARKSIGFSTALKLMHISKTTYHTWLAETKSQCLDSPFRLFQSPEYELVAY